ncbi:hypothetical protein EOA46_27510 [Mesorhizobium sp. M1A.F.Ca.IN.022.05.2.1]|uniref:hypothetical protein n=2 Tax=unclassified Mesorhizobium TaxID=325217 RepID=UPI000FCB75DA|nr:hypothetical protein [Mesorhizobium sp. M1A.F.Ca.IN.022.05.2.1]RUW05837.1 hypothetical protein EOA46_27510 [Mesorhizobium sp. M1A.F.Ca.IN.022.05.2.1]TIR82831.1 MAG: hypothetical protein E5X19_29425 [Mesorhizobium sp.]TIS84266.1 MAG: hypothetical protein E5W99_14135 [Mesorhizobium sp.]
MAKPAQSNRHCALQIVLRVNLDQPERDELTAMLRIRRANSIGAQILLAADAGETTTSSRQWWLSAAPGGTSIADDLIEFVVPQEVSYEGH